MAVTPSPTRTSGTFDSDLLVIGGGPAGCAAARMASSVGMQTILIEPQALCRSLHRIPALDNTLGGYRSGPELADAINTELNKTELCHIELGSRTTELRAYDDHVAVIQDNGQRLTAPYTVVATGVRNLGTQDVPWITAPSDLTLPPLWQAKSGDAEGCTLLVLGGDRPIGTFLRAFPNTDTHLLVAYPEDDDYKVEEVREDPRVTLLPLAHLTLTFSGTAVHADIVNRGGQRESRTADAAFLSLGAAPAPPVGDLLRDSTGYCAPSRQHPRVIVAGDLRSARFQRVMTAMGSGAEAALHAYYASRGLDRT